MALSCCSSRNLRVTSSIESCRRSQKPARSWKVGTGNAVGSCSGRSQGEAASQRGLSPSQGLRKPHPTLTVQFHLEEWSGDREAGRQERAQTSPSWAQTPVLTSRHPHALVIYQAHTPGGLYAHEHSPCFADTAGRTAEPFGTGEVVCCPRHCGFSPGLESKRRWGRGIMPLLPLPPGSLPRMTLTPLVIWHHPSVSLLRPLPVPYTQDTNKQFLPHFTKKTDSPDTDVSCII